MIILDIDESRIVAKGTGTYAGLGVEEVIPVPEMLIDGYTTDDIIECIPVNTLNRYKYLPMGDSFISVEY